MAGKYTPLENYLRALRESQKDVTLSFDHIEEILSDKLPRSAYQHRAWWANEKVGSHIHARSWLDAGWKVETVNFSQKWVRVVRT
jgi:hypothetical protein